MLVFTKTNTWLMGRSSCPERDLDRPASNRQAQPGPSSPHEVLEAPDRCKLVLLKVPGAGLTPQGGTEGFTMSQISKTLI